MSETTREILISIIQLIIVLVPFRSYFKKKAENLATKQDIKGITTQIEAIKYQYATLLEKDKYEYNLTFQSLLSLFSKKDDITFQLFQNSTKLYYELCHIDFNFHLLELNKENIERINVLSSEVLTNRATISVLFKNEQDLLEKTENLTRLIINATSNFSRLSQNISLIQSKLSKENIYSKINNIITVNDITKMNLYKNEINDHLSEYITYIYSIGLDLDNSRTIYLSSVQNYYEMLKFKMDSITQGDPKK